MIELALIIPLLLLFVYLWRFAEKCPALFAKMLQQQNAMAEWLNTLLVFSATTTGNREAEFIDDRLPEQRKLARLIPLFRALLIVSYFLFAAYWLRKW
jgi:hypothetical protein